MITKLVSLAQMTQLGARITFPSTWTWFPAFLASLARGSPCWLSTIHTSSWCSALGAILASPALAMSLAVFSIYNDCLLFSTVRPPSRTPFCLGWHFTPCTLLPLSVDICWIYKWMMNEWMDTSGSGLNLGDRRERYSFFLQASWSLARGGRWVSQKLQF